MGKWHADSIRRRLYEAIKASGAEGMRTFEAFDMFPTMTEANLRLTLQSLSFGRYVTRTGKGVCNDPYRYFVTADCLHPATLPNESRVVFDLVEDCPAGVDEAVLAQELRLRPVAIRRRLQPAIEQGMVEAVVRSPGCLAYRPLPVVPAAAAGSAS